MCISLSLSFTEANIIDDQLSDVFSSRPSPHPAERSLYLHATTQVKKWI